MFSQSGREESTSGVTTLGKTLHYLFEIPFIRKANYCPLRDVARLIVFLIPHVPLTVILTGKH